jgi:hypothetical protein
MFNNEIFTTHFKNTDIEIEEIKEYFFGRRSKDDDDILLIDFEIMATATLDYRFSAEVRSWGIKSISTDIVRFHSEIEWSVEKTKYLTDKNIKLLLDKGGVESKNYITGVVKVDTLKNGFENRTWDITNQIEFESDGGYHFSMVYINLPKKELIFVS